MVSDASLRSLSPSRIVWLIFALTLSLSCRHQPPIDTVPVTPPAPPALVMAAVDGSRSFGAFVPGAVLRWESVLKQIPPGSTVYLRWLTSDSYPATNAIAVATLPLPPPNSSSNPFARRGRAVLAQAQQHRAAAETALIEALAQTPTPRSQRTDLDGFLVVCAERFAAKPNVPHLVVVFSDLDANVSRYSKMLSSTALAGATVLVVSYQPASPNARAVRLAQFRRLGATMVYLLGPDEPLPSNLLPSVESLPTTATRKPA